MFFLKLKYELQLKELYKKERYKKQEQDACPLNNR